jgi:type IV secretion system protein VirD4
MEHDSHWSDKAAQVITAVLVMVLLRFEGKERSLNSVQEIISDQDLLMNTGTVLRQMGGMPARLGAQLKTLFQPGPAAVLTKEGASVISVAGRHLSFLDSDLVSAAVASSTFDPNILLVPGTTLYVQIPPEQLEAAKGLLRCWLSTLVRVVGAVPVKGNEVLFLIDEASALGSLPALEEALVRGRSAGVRLLLAYQSDSQVQSAFKDKPSLLYDNCSVQIYLGASSYETAERLSKSLGEWTQVVEGFNTNESSSFSHSIGQSSSESRQAGRGSGLNYSVNGRALLRPDEILTLDDNLLITLMRGMPPVLARRIKYYSDPAFSKGVQVRRKVGWWLLMAAAIGLIVWSLSGKVFYHSIEPKVKEVFSGWKNR